MNVNDAIESLKQGGATPSEAANMVRDRVRLFDDTRLAKSYWGQS